MKKTTKTKKKQAAKKTTKAKAQVRPEFDIDEAVEIMRSVSRLMKD